MDYVRKLGLLRLLPPMIRRKLMTARYQREVATDGEPELPHLGALLEPGDLAVDVGCNLGVYSYELGRITGNVIAFEANPILAGFVSGLRLRGVREVRSIALGAEPGAADLFIPPFRTGHQAATLAHNGAAAHELIRVEVERLDDQGLSGVRFIKIDVEGFEEAVLDGASSVITTDRPALLIEIEERHNPGGLSRIAARLAAKGYKGRFLLDNIWQPLDCYEPDAHQRNDPTFWSSTKGKARRDVIYVNNFLFTPT